MPKFVVKVREIHYQDYAVEAESAEDAKAAVAACEGEAVENTLEYSHIDDDMSAWVVEKVGD